ncbi:hypothetical protein JCM11641_008046 [Rhodosporidiobolus odoratus]
MTASTGLANGYHRSDPASTSHTAALARTALDTASSISRTVKDEAKQRMAELQGQQSHHRTFSAPSVTPCPPPPTQAAFRPRKVPPPPRPIFPPSPPHSLDVADEKPQTVVGKTPEGSGLAAAEKQEQDQLWLALQHSLRDESIKSMQTQEGADEDLEKALAESRALESVRLQRRSTYEAQEQTDLEAALRASQQTKTPEPSIRFPSGSSRLYRSHSASSLPSFSPSDLAHSAAYPSEKSRMFPEGRPTLPPGAAGAWDDESREMEMLALAIRISEEEERERKMLEEKEEKMVLDQVRRAEAAVLQGRGMLPPDAGPGDASSGMISPDSSTSFKTANAPATTSPPFASAEKTSKEKKRSSWFRPPITSKLSAEPSSGPLPPAPPPRPSLQPAATSGATVQTFRTAPEGLPFSNLDSVEAAGPSQTTDSRPHVPNSAFPSPVVPPTSSSAFASSPSTLDQNQDRFREENDGSPFEMPTLSPSTSLRSSGPSGSRHSSWARPGLASVFAAEEYDRLPSGSGSGGTSANGGRGSRARTFSGATILSQPSGSISSVDLDMLLASDEAADADERASVLAVRNPDDRAASATPDSTRSSTSSHSYFSGSGERPHPSSSSEDGSNTLEHLYQHDETTLPGHPGYPIFESAYAGRSMSAIDETTEPASSVIGIDHGAGAGEGSRQGSFPSTLGAGAVENSHNSPPPPVLAESKWMGGGGRDGSGGDAGVPFPSSSPTSFNTGFSRPTHTRRGSSGSSAASASRAAHVWPPSSPSLAGYSPPQPREQVDQHSAAHPSTISTSIPAAAVAASPTPGSLGALPLPPTSFAPSGSNRSSLDGAAAPLGTPPLAPEDGLRFGYPASCARQIGHACPDDGLSPSTSVPSVIELSISSVANLEDGTGGQAAERDKWAVEARSWVALLRFLMWFGDTRVGASSHDTSSSPSGRCAATASLEFRPDDEGLPILRLVLSLLPPSDPASHLPMHREISVSQPQIRAKTPPGKGKQRATSQSRHDRPTTHLATFTLPDVLHLPTRLSSLAIQLYTLRHLASIARATQPARSPPALSSGFGSQSGSGAEGYAEGYLALRELADSISALAKAAYERESSRIGSGRDSGGAKTPRANVGLTNESGGGVRRGDMASPPAEEQTQRLVDRLKDRLKRLKRHNDGNENSSPATAAPLPAGANGGAVRRGSKLVKPPRPPRTQPVARSERVLAAQTIRSNLKWQEEASPAEEFHENASREEQLSSTVAEAQRPRQVRTSTQSNLKYMPQL